MNWKKHLTVWTVLTIFLAGVSLQARPPRKQMNPEKRLAHMKKVLKLSDDQVGKIRKIGEENKPVRVKTRSQIKALHSELHALLSSDNPERSKVKSKLEEIGRLRIEMRMTGFDQRQKIAKVLTTEQRSQWKKRMQKRMQRFKVKREARQRGPSDF